MTILNFFSTLKFFRAFLIMKMVFCKKSDFFSNIYWNDHIMLSLIYVYPTSYLLIYVYWTIFAFLEWNQV